MHRLIKKLTTVAVALALTGVVSAQTQPPGIPNIQKLTNNAMKISIGIGAASAGAAVLGLIIKHHHHKSGVALTPIGDSANAALHRTPVKSLLPADAHASVQTQCPSGTQNSSSTSNVAADPSTPNDQHWNWEAAANPCPAI